MTDGVHFSLLAVLPAVCNGKSLKPAVEHSRHLSALTSQCNNTMSHHNCADLRVTCVDGSPGGGAPVLPRGQHRVQRRAGLQVEKVPHHMEACSQRDCSHAVMPAEAPQACG